MAEITSPPIPIIVLARNRHEFEHWLHMQPQSFRRRYRFASGLRDMEGRQNYMHIVLPGFWERMGNQETEEMFDRAFLFGTRQDPDWDRR